MKAIILKYKTLFYNFSYLSILQVSNILIPLITYPYLIRVLGSSNYGKVIFAQTVMMYFGIFVNFGFNIIGTQEISINRKNITKVGRIASSIYQLKFLLFTISLIITFLVLVMIDASLNDFLLYGLSSWVCLYEFLFPVWYFQGIEKMKNIALISVLNKVLVLVAILLLIKEENDYLFVPTINFFGIVISCIISLYILWRDKVCFTIQSRLAVFTYFKRSYVLATSFAINTAKNNMNVLFVKSFFSYSAVAKFDLALRIVTILTTFLDIVSQVVFPKMVQNRDKRFLKKIINISLICSVIIMLMIQGTANFAVFLLGGEDMLDSVTILRILVFILPFYITSALLGTNGLTIYGKNSSILFSKIVSIAGYFSVLIIFLFFNNWEPTFTALAVSLVSSYGFETLFRYIMCRKFKII